MATAVAALVPRPSVVPPAKKLPPGNQRAYLILLTLADSDLQLLLHSLPDQAPRWASFVLDVRMVIFTLATCIVCALLFGWAPALHAMNPDLRSAVASATGRFNPRYPRPPHARRARRRGIRAGVADVRVRRCPSQAADIPTTSRD